MQNINKIKIGRVAFLLMIGCMSSVFLSNSAFSRSLEEIRKTNELRLCVAGSSHALYTAMGMAFANEMGIPAKVKKLESWDQQFHNPEGITVREETYTPELMASGSATVIPMIWS